ncbi:MFS transporter [Paenibacillus pinihumi]|uniref:MFS transporter n=1 Tax=Paenibacillus pinihumi TaxID=669462 RepID=UPI0009DC0ECA|nr:MFS transporter [Paenibacillus pinihumi]
MNRQNTQYSITSADSKREEKREARRTSPLPASLTLLFAVAAGLSVANIYFAQPLLDMIALEFGIQPASIGSMITITQICYALGLFFLVPLGDFLNQKRLVLAHMLLTAIALIIVGTASEKSLLLAGFALVGLLAVVVQVLVAFASKLSSPASRGQTVGMVTSGIVIGILLARTFAGIVSDLAGWRAVYYVSAALTLLLAAILFRALPGSHRQPMELSYPQLLRSMLALFVHEPVLRIRAILCMLIFTVFSILWTPLVLPLSAPPLSLAHSVIGLFGLAGAAGAIGAARAGRLADRGFGQRTTFVALLILIASWLPISLLQHSLWALAAGIVILDLAVQAVHVTNQAMILSAQSAAGSRLTATYMIFYSIGSAAGAIASTVVYAYSGWSGVCVLGAAVSTLTLLFWSFTKHHMPAAMRS